MTSMYFGSPSCPPLDPPGCPPLRLMGCLRGLLNRTLLSRKQAGTEDSIHSATPHADRASAVATCNTPCYSNNHHAVMPGLLDNSKYWGDVSKEQYDTQECGSMTGIRLHNMCVCSVTGGYITLGQCSAQVDASTLLLVRFQAPALCSPFAIDY